MPQLAGMQSGVGYLNLPAGGAAADETAAAVRAARAGDRQAFARLYARYSRLVHGLLLAQAPPGEAGDLMQDVFLRALEKLSALRDPAAFGGWVAMIARNTARNRRRALRPTVEAEPSAPAQQPAETEALTILSAIRQLPLAYRETLILRLVEGMTGPEIAERTGLRPSSVRVNLHRGMKLLRLRLTGRAEDVDVDEG
jgi:RNA polymerase sigma-70 factor (ECF subfamily)